MSNTVEYYLPINKLHDVLIHAIMWMNLESTVPNERGQTEEPVCRPKTFTQP